VRARNSGVGCETSSTPGPIFLVDHDMGLVLNICDYLYVIEFGKKIAEGTRRTSRTIRR
jgi:ABC-type branched-subunit amino acid transport system ATPase component